MTEGPRKLLNVSEAARRMGIHPHTLRSWADRGVVPVTRTLTGYRQFDPDDVDRVIAEMREGKLAA